ncbi:hypothetical protein JW707_02590, partial [Candidatus Woesearchaeota archaeon]|nr:hypothetical protein [Candidatus Woesearchaeota archaeon]
MKKISTGGVQGATFGVMEATIMMLGVLLGLSVTGQKFIIILGLFTAGIADSLANSASFYVSEESEMIHTRKEIFKATKMCFLGTFLTAVIIALPIVLIKNIQASIAASFSVGIITLIFLGNYMSKKLKSATPG